MVFAMLEMLMVMVAVMAPVILIVLVFGTNGT